LCVFFGKNKTASNLYCIQTILWRIQCTRPIVMRPCLHAADVNRLTLRLPN
jgi:hypothetical protein